MSECEYCTKPATWILNVQWSVVDFLDTLACDQHLTPATTYWQRRTVEGLDPIVTRQPILDAPIPYSVTDQGRAAITS